MKKKKNQAAWHHLCHRPQPTHLHHLKKKICSKVPRGAKPGGDGAPRSRVEPHPPAGRERERPARLPALPALLLPVPLLLTARKPASASPTRDAPSSPCPKANATRRCSRSRPRRQQRESSSLGRGERAGAPGAPRHSRRRSLLPAPRIPTWEAARGYGQELRSSYRRWKPYCCVRLRRGSAASFTFSCRCFLTLIPPPPCAPSPPSPPRPSLANSVSYRTPLVPCCTPAPETGIKNRSCPSSRQSPHRRRRKTAKRAQAASGGGTGAAERLPNRRPMRPAPAGARDPHTGAAWGENIKFGEKK